MGTDGYATAIPPPKKVFKAQTKAGEGWDVNAVFRDKNLRASKCKNAKSWIENRTRAAMDYSDDEEDE